MKRRRHHPTSPAGRPGAPDDDRREPHPGRPAARVRRALAVLLVLSVCAGLSAAELPFPPPKFAPGYEMPTAQMPAPRAGWREGVDVCVLAAAMGVAAWLALAKRSRRGMLWLAIFSLLYFGLYREGCVCPIGSIQNVTLALADSAYALPFTVVLFFALPLLFALLFGRVFCAAVCPLGALQEVVLIRPVQLPSWLTQALRLVPFIYLGAAVLFAATNTMFIICRYDPFVAFFRLAGPFHMLVVGAVFLILSTFVGRPYCRFLCPYGALLSLVSRGSWRKVSVTPDECVVCSLCHKACPFDAIEPPTPQGAIDEP